MKIVLLKDVPKIGRKGEIKEVSDGFGNNMLIRKGLAQLATKEVQEKVARENQESAQKLVKLKSQLERQKRELEKQTFTLKVKVGDKGQIFSGIHEKDIIAAVEEKAKITLDKSQIDLHSGIKSQGQHQIKLKLGQGINATLKINIEAL